MNLRWIVAAAAWAAFSIAVWFIGDLLALGSHRPLEGTLERIALIVAVGAAFVAWEARTPDEPKECWPFTAIRLENGHTLVNLTHGNRTVEFDPAGKIVWQVSNEDLAAPLFKDPCGAQRLPNGNTVIASYGMSGKGVKLFEVTREKKVVWTWTSDRPGVHHVQILETNGTPMAGVPHR